MIFFLVRSDSHPKLHQYEKGLIFFFRLERKRGGGERGRERDRPYLLRRKKKKVNCKGKILTINKWSKTK